MPHTSASLSACFGLMLPKIMTDAFEPEKLKLISIDAPCCSDQNGILLALHFSLPDAGNTFKKAFEVMVFAVDLDGGGDGSCAAVSATGCEKSVVAQALPLIFSWNQQPCLAAWPHNPRCVSRLCPGTVRQGTDIPRSRL